MKNQNIAVVIEPLYVSAYMSKVSMHIHTFAYFYNVGIDSNGIALNPGNFVMHIQNRNHLEVEVKAFRIQNK